MFAAPFVIPDMIYISKPKQRCTLCQKTWRSSDRLPSMVILMPTECYTSLWIFFFSLSRLSL